MTVFAYPEKHSPKELNPCGEFVVVHHKPVHWPNVIMGPRLKNGLPRVGRFLAKLRGPLVPLSEEAVFAAALADPEWVPRALACTHRRVQAELLGDLSPGWWLPHAAPKGPPPWWFKALASDMSRGVRKVEHAESLDEVARKCRRGAHENLRWLHHLGVDSAGGIVQEHLPGPQYEITGVVGDQDEQLWFEPLVQTWRGSFIERYDPAPRLEGEMVALGKEVVLRLGLSWCFVCIEARRAEDGWRVIEAHARPGDDLSEKGYPSVKHLRGGIEALSQWALKKNPQGA